MKIDKRHFSFHGTKNRGVALLTALLVTSIATVIAVSLSSRQFVDMRRTGNLLESDQAYMYAIGLETVAKQLLSKYSQAYKYDDPELLFKPYTFPVEGGVVSGTLVDLEGLFNVNNVVGANGKRDEKRYEQFVRLLGFVMDNLNVRPASADDLANAVVDWIDNNEEVTQGGAEDTEYQVMEIPYRTPNRRMGSATELALVKGFTRELLYGKEIDEKQVPGLLHYVTALPQSDTRINPNTADELVLRSLTRFIDAKVAADIKSDRPFKTLEEFTDGSAIKAVKNALNDADKKILSDALAGVLDVQSSYHIVNSVVTVGSSSITLNSMLYRNTTGTKIDTVSRAQGTNGI